MNLADIAIGHFSGTWAKCWDLDLQSHATGHSIGKASYRSDRQQGILHIAMGGLCLEASTTNGDFLCGGGYIHLDNRRIAVFNVPYPTDFHIKLLDSRNTLSTSIDGWARRFRWAWRQGCSWTEARKYAAWGERITGCGLILASSLCVISSRKYASETPLLNAQDAAIAANLPLDEQMCLLVILLRKMCGSHLHLRHRSGVLSPIRSQCPNIPSSIPIACHGKHYISCNPDDLAYRKSRKMRFGEFIATGHPLCKLSIAACLLAICIVWRTDATIILGIIAVAIWLFMLLIRKIDHADKAPQRIIARHTAPESQPHSPSSSR